MNMLRAMVYVPAIRSGGLASIVDRLVEIDVEIKIEDVEEEDNWSDEDADCDDGVPDMQFAMDGDKGDGDQPEEAQVDVMAEKLDNMLLLLYHYLREVCKEHNEAVDIFESLLQIFDRSILPTHRLKYTQFILFYTASLADGLSVRFLQHLFQKLENSAEPILRRQACAAYIGSYIARCNHLGQEQMIAALQHLASQALVYVDLMEPSQQFPDAEVHTLFYTICQAILYALCYKRDVLCGSNNNRDLGTLLQLHRIVHCPLKPLKFLLDSVVREFATVADQLGVEGYAEALEANADLVLPSRSAYGGENRIELFFPFDPYLLRYSHMFITNLYQEWSQDADEWMTEECDNSEQGSIGSSIPSSPHSLLDGMSLDMRSLSATLDQDLPIRSMSAGSAASPGFQHVLQRPRYG